MKKLINKTIILSLFVALTGCNDWLDVSPKADMKAEDLFGTEAGFRDALVGVYALMCGTNSYGRDLTYGYLDVLAQYYNSPLKTTSSGYEHNFKNAAEYKYTEKTEESRISSIWSNHFSAVANINQAMLFIDENKGVFTSPEVHDVYKGDRVMNTLQDLIKQYASQYIEQVIAWLFCISIYSVYSLLRLR